MWLVDCAALKVSPTCNNHNNLPWIFVCHLLKVFVYILSSQRDFFWLPYIMLQLFPTSQPTLSICSLFFCCCCFYFKAPITLWYSIWVYIYYINVYLSLWGKTSLISFCCLSPLIFFLFSKIKCITFNFSI